MAYRTSRAESTTKRSAEPGIVDDMVRQFADRYAFLRELVQNGIDAGATRIEVRIDRDADGAVTTSVDDDGVGMTRAIIEGPLLTLFSSSKEKDSSKIGKYGIGFVSVFAMNPEHVDVHTRRDSEHWRVRLFGDHSYELAELERDRVGTTVSLLQLKQDAAMFDGHVEKARIALIKWCRHARVPITLLVLDADNIAAANTTSINLPLEVPSLVHVTSVEGDETFVVGAGQGQGSAREDTSTTFGGFYNRGLTLFETANPERNLGGLRFKVDSRNISHTLSRDNVKRDREHTRVLDRICALVQERLYPELIERLDRATLDVAANHRDERAIREYRLLLDATLAGAFQFAKGAGIRLPLVEEIDGKRTLALSDLKVGPSGDMLIGDGSTALTRALAAHGHPVVHSAAQMLVLREAGRRAVLEPSRALGHVVRIDETRRHDGDNELAERLVRLIKDVGLNAAKAVFAVFDGANATESFRVVKANLLDEAITVPVAEEEKKDWGRSATLFLNVEDAGVRLARRRARTRTASDVEAAAHLLVRRILIEEQGALTEKMVDRLLEAAAATAASSEISDGE